MNEKLQKANLLKKDNWTTDEFKAFTGKESDLQKSCEDLLQYYPNIKVLRVPNLLYFVLFSKLRDGSPRFKIVDCTTQVQIPGGWYKEIARWFRGVPDLVLIKKNQTAYQGNWKKEGNPIEVLPLNDCMVAELKTKKGKLTKHQKKFGEVVNLIEIRSFEEFEQRLKEFSEYG